MFTTGDMAPFSSNVAAVLCRTGLVLLLSQGIIAIPFNATRYLPLVVSDTGTALHFNLAEKFEEFHELESSKNVVPANITEAKVEPFVNPETRPKETTNIVGYWPFEAKNTLHDYSVNGLHAVCRNSSDFCEPLTVPGVIGDALVLDGTHFLVVEDGPFVKHSLALNDGLSFAMFIKANSTGEFDVERSIMERSYHNFGFSIRPFQHSVSCFLRDDGNTIYKAYLSLDELDIDLMSWIHLACVYDNERNDLTLYINGDASKTTNVSDMTQLFTHGDHQPIGIGGRGQFVNGFDPDSDLRFWVGAIDELLLWDRPLSEVEVIALQAEENGGRWTSILEPDLGTTLVSKTFHTGSASLPAKLMSGIAIELMTSGSAPPLSIDALELRVSVDKGTVWCPMTLTADSENPFLLRAEISISDHFANPQDTITRPHCLFPATSFKYKITWFQNIAIHNITVVATEYNLNDLDSLHQPPPDMALGWNVQGISYWSDGKVFGDAFVNTEGCCRDDVFASGVAVDAHKYPLQLPGSRYSTNWYSVVGTASTIYPEGTYHLLSKGQGNLRIRGAGLNKWFTSPVNFTFTVNHSTLSQLTIDQGSDFLIDSSESMLGDHVRDIQLFLPGATEPTPEAPNPLFHPDFLDSLGPNPQTLRFMDWGKTNGANIAHWADRQVVGAPQGSRSLRVVNVSSIVVGNVSVYTRHTGETGLVVTTTEPHALETGQSVDISNTDGSVTVRRGDGSTFSTHFNVGSLQAYVLDTTTFEVDLRSWQFGVASTDVVESVVAATTGVIEIEIEPGVAIEHMIELANKANVDPWFCIPHLATDDYVEKFAQLIKLLLNPHLKVYIELSNEFWNWQFSQTHHMSRMSNLLGVSKPQYEATRMIQVYEIFDDVLATTHTLCKVVPSQSSNMWLSDELLSVFQDPLLNPHNVTVQAMAIAPYFGGNQAEYMERDADGHRLYESLTVDDILDAALGKVYSDTYRATIVSKDIATKHGVDLIAYEGGQHMGGGPYENHDELQALFIAANRDPRMFGLYDCMHRAWNSAGGKLFATFSHTGGHSKWGSWGQLESSDKQRSPQTTPKYSNTLWFMNSTSSSVSAATSTATANATSTAFPATATATATATVTASPGASTFVSTATATAMSTPTSVSFDCPKNCGSPEEGGGDCDNNGQCLSCNSNKLLVTNTTDNGVYSGTCKLAYRCLNAKVETVGDIFGRDCKCEERRCHRCDKTAEGDVCLKCKGERYLFISSCVDECSPTMTSVGNKDIGRRCSNPFTCDSNVPVVGEGEGAVGGGKCICSTPAHKNHNACKVCAFEAGGFGQNCSRCGLAQYLNPETNQCDPDCSLVQAGPVVEYKVGRNGAECRQPFTCNNGVDEEGQACKCSNKLTNCVVCDWIVPTEAGGDRNVCTVCGNNKYLKKGVCVRKCGAKFTEHTTDTEIGWECQE